MHLEDIPHPPRPRRPIVATGREERAVSLLPMAGVFTRSKCPSAPVEWCRAKLGRGQARALVVNSGNANAFTGKTGRQATSLTASIAAKIGRAHV